MGSLVIQAAVNKYLAVADLIRKRDNKYHLYLAAEERLTRESAKLDKAIADLGPEDLQKYKDMVATFEKERAANG